MSKPPRDRAVASSNTYFLTISAYQHQALFQRTCAAELFVATIFAYRDQHKFLLHEFVVIPDHVHVLLKPAPDVALERSIQFIKGGFSFRAGKELGMRSEMWQRGYVDHRIRNSADYEHHRVYIWSNPATAHLSENAEAFRQCSASGNFRLDPAPQGLKPLFTSAVNGTTEVVPSHDAR